MVSSDDRLGRWRERRARRLQELGFLRAQASPDGPPAFCVADEMLVREDHHRTADDVLASHGHTDVSHDTVAGFRRYRAPGLDVLTATSDIRRQAESDGDTRAAASPNHVFLSTPFEHGGPFGPPMPAVTPGELANARHGDRVGIAVLDTGVWRDSPLPPGYYEATPADFESNVDVDHDGVLDGDVGHANFVAGVIAQNAPHAQIQIIRVLDTFGLCTEADLITALSRVDDSTSLINLSLGGYTVDDEPPMALRDALSQLLATGDRLLVAAAGNDGQRGRGFWPAAFTTTTEPWHDRVVAVAAHDGQRLCAWSNSAPWVTLAAPGHEVTSTYVRREPFSTGWAQWSGTSFATPYVVAALTHALPAAESARAALTTVLSQAAQHSYDNFPGLP